MYIYQLQLEFLNDAIKKTILAVLPAENFTIESPIPLNEICLMQFARKATSDILYKLDETATLNLVDEQSQCAWDSYLSNDWNQGNHLIQPVLKFSGFDLVDKACDWNIEADPLDVMEYIYFTSTVADGPLPESDDQIWFDCHLPNVMTKESNCDFDNEVRASGVIQFDRVSKDLHILLTDDFKTCQAIFDLPETKAHFLTLVDWLFNQSNFRSLDISGDEIQNLATSKA